MFKAACTVWLARVLLPLESDSMNAWFHIFPPIAAILGHNYSIFLARRAINGRLRLHGGAGGASCVGGSFGLWEPSVLLIIPIAGLILYFVGYASIATLCVGLLSTILFTILATFNILPWQYVLYGILSEVILVWSLRPNISRLLRGSERLIGFRARNGKAVVKNT
jgi:glycerol-3-phosphate acyltransferase PlsY